MKWEPDLEVQRDPGVIKPGVKVHACLGQLRKLFCRDLCQPLLGQAVHSWKRVISPLALQAALLFSLLLKPGGTGSGKLGVRVQLQYPSASRYSFAPSSLVISDRLYAASTGTLQNRLPGSSVRPTFL